MEKRSRRNRRDLLAEGLDLLAREGPDALTIERLCTRLAVTKGSFYHHFRGREEFVRALLEHWVEECTLRLIEAARQEESPGGRRARIMRDALALPAGPDTAVRAWAQRDPLVAEYVGRADVLRLDFLKEVILPFAGDSEAAGRAARMVYLLYVGAKSIIPPLTEAEYRETVTALTIALGLPTIMADVPAGPKPGEKHDTP